MEQAKRKPKPDIVEVVEDQSSSSGKFARKLSNDGTWPALHVAIKGGDADEVAVLLQQLRDENTLDAVLNSVAGAEALTPAALAVCIGSIAILKLLRSAGANLRTARDAKGWSLLHSCAWNSNEEICNWLITDVYEEPDELRQMLEGKAKDGSTAVLIAGANNRLGVLKLLFSNGANLLAVNKDGWNLFHYCAKTGHGDVIVWLTDAAADKLSQMVKTKSKEGNTPALIAVTNGQLQSLQLLVKAGANMHTINKDGWTMLHKCAKYGHHEICSYLIEQYRSSNDLSQMMKCRTNEGNSPALIAASNGQLRILKLLIEAGANVQTMNKEKSTLLHKCSRNGHSEVCLWLIDMYRSSNDLSQMLESKTVDGDSPVLIAGANGHLEVVKALAAAGASLSVANKDGWTLLHKVASMGYDSICLWLLEWYRESNQLWQMLEYLNKEGLTALSLAAKHGNVSVLKQIISVLILERADLVNCCGTARGDTALHLALLSGHEACASELLQYSNIEVNVRNDVGRTPLYLAAMMGLADIVRQLIGKNANLELACKEGFTPLQVAASKGHLQTVRTLLDAGAKLVIDCNPDYNVVISNRALHSYLQQLAASSDAQDAACLKSVVQRDSSCVLLRLLVEMGFDLECDGTTWEATEVAVINYTKSRISSFPIHAAIRRSVGQDNKALLDQLDSQASNIFDIDYFGQTPLMTAIKFGAHPSIVEAVMQQCLKSKLGRNFTSPIVVKRSRHDGLKFPSFRLPSVVMKAGKIYVEATLHTSKIFQIGVASPDWQLDDDDANGVGDSVDSIGIDGSRQCYFDNGIKKKDMAIPKWSKGTVVGIVIDSESKQLDFYFSGEKLILKDPISLNSLGNRGCLIVFSMEDDQACEFNFGEMAARPLLSMPSGCISVQEYSGRLGTSFAPFYQVFNKSNLVWENTVPSANCSVSKYYYDFARAIQSRDDAVTTCACRVIRNNHALMQTLANDLNEDRQRLADIASKPCRQAISDLLHFCGRYDLASSKPEYESASCILFLARDIETNKQVAIKLMNDKDNFTQELESRRRLDPAVSSEFILPVISVLKAEENSPLYGELERRNYSEYKYGIIMPAAKRNLHQILAAENLSKKLTEVRRLFEDLVRCVDHIHSRGFIHGDIKPLNIMKNAEDRLILIDLDASCLIGQPAGRKCSSAFVPPEMLFWDESAQQCCLKNSKAVSEGSSQPLLASTSIDVWALGVVLFQMCTGEALWLSSYDSIDQRQQKQLIEWDSNFKQEKLEKISELEARNLVSRLLSKVPTDRPTLSAILQHPFVSGRRAVRMIGQAPAFDVFISYRVSTDRDICDQLYETLTSRNLRVWMDRKNIKDGSLWEDEFCDGLVNCQVVVCLISVDAIAAKPPSRSFTSLREDSPCDNVLLEHRLALELEKMSMIAHIFPVFIGRREAGTCAAFDWSCMKEMPHVSVNAVKQKMIQHLERQRLGSPLTPELTVQQVVANMAAHQGCLCEGVLEQQLLAAADRIERICKDRVQSPALVSGPAMAESSETEMISLKNKVAAMETEIQSLREMLATKNNELCSLNNGIRAVSPVK
jgi:ankyrin repeat protein/serine/threonine protein kinase